MLKNMVLLLLTPRKTFTGANPGTRRPQTEEKAATESLIARIQELQNTEGEELSGVQIITHFPRIRVSLFKLAKIPFGYIRVLKMLIEFPNIFL